MFASLQHGVPQMHCLPFQGQLANARAAPAWHRTAVGACELTNLRHWSPSCAAPSPALSSRLSQKSRCAVLTQACLDLPGGLPEWDVVALGQSMVDISAYVDDAFIEQMGVAKGGRRY